MTQTNPPPVVVVCGMDFEAKIADGPGVLVIYGQNRHKLAAGISALLAQGVSGLISFGTAGGLDPGLAPGDVIVADGVVTETRKYAPDPVWVRHVSDTVVNLPILDKNRAGSEKLAGLRENGSVHVKTASIYASGTPALTVADKAAIRRATGASGIDMESDLVADAAAKYALPFIVIRVVIDPADRAVPQSALKGVREDGTSNPIGVLAALTRRPGDLAALVRLARDANAAQKSLLRCRQRVGPLFGLLDARQLPLNME